MMRAKVWGMWYGSRFYRHFPPREWLFSRRPGLLAHRRVQLRLAHVPGRAVTFVVARMVRARQFLKVREPGRRCLGRLFIDPLD